MYALEWLAWPRPLHLRRNKGVAVAELPVSAFLLVPRHIVHHGCGIHVIYDQTKVRCDQELAQQLLDVVAIAHDQRAYNIKGDESR